jgi:hypothetical protein
MNHFTFSISHLTLICHLAFHNNVTNSINKWRSLNNKPVSNFTFHISHFTLISHLVFNKKSTYCLRKCELLNDKLMKNVKCQLLINSEGITV